MSNAAIAGSRNAAPSIRDLMQAKGMTQEAAARAASISLPTVHRAVSTNRWPAQYRTRAALAQVLGLAEVPPAPASVET